MDQNVIERAIADQGVFNWTEMEKKCTIQYGKISSLTFFGLGRDAAKNARSAGEHRGWTGGEL